MGDTGATEGRSLPLSAEERSIVSLLCDTLVARGGPGGAESALRASASDRGVDRELVRIVDEYLSPVERAEFRRLLRAVVSRGTNLLLSGRPERFDRLSLPERERYLRAWSVSRLPVKRRGFHALKRLVLFLHYAGVDADGSNPVWAEIGYRPTGPPDPSELSLPPLPPPEPPSAPVDLEVDAVVVGSGAGGSVIAERLARGGHRVVVLEEGGYWRGAGLPDREAPAFDRLLHSHGLLTTSDRAIGVLAGRGAGGSTTVNWMTCLRPPPEVRREWATEFGMSDLATDGFDDRLRRVEGRLHVSVDESDRNPTNNALAVGCERLGYTIGRDYEVIARNASGCRSRCQPCSFGCPFDAKQSSLVTYLDAARAYGAGLFCDTHVDRIESAGGRASGVVATCHTAGGTIPVRIRARATVVAGGAVETPALLHRSGFRGAVGRGLHLHPTAAILAEYDRPIRNWEGPMQTIAVRRFTHAAPGLHGPWIESAPAHPGLSALATPWRGSDEHKAAMRRLERSAATIVLVRDVGAGHVATDRSGNPILHYRLHRADRASLTLGLVEAARIHWAAGARRIATLHTRQVEAGDGTAPVTAAELETLQEAIRREGIQENSLALFSAHPTGSAHAGPDARLAAARPSGELHGIDDLWIGDGALLPTAPGVNPMITIMAMAERTADEIGRRLASAR